uniref:Uncharacterized protein n=1 Tax=Anguilla anguilla TaxID=7936 RepID=A0A0E9RQJ4_ANGAN
MCIYLSKPIFLSRVQKVAISLHALSIPGQWALFVQNIEKTCKYRNKVKGIFGRWSAKYCSIVACLICN